MHDGTERNERKYEGSVKGRREKRIKAGWEEIGCKLGRRKGGKDEGMDWGGISGDHLFKFSDSSTG
jgi:hypothetical protein